MKRNIPILVILVVFAGVLWFRGKGGGVAPVPPVFAEKLTLAAAGAKAKEEGKLVFAMATADWCGPCQEMKRGPLRDPAVESWVREHAVTAYLDTDHSNEIGELRIIGIPTFMMFKDGTELGRLSGGADRDELLAWLESSLATAKGAK